MTPRIQHPGFSTPMLFDRFDAARRNPATPLGTRVLIDDAQKMIEYLQELALQQGLEILAQPVVPRRTRKRCQAPITDARGVTRGCRRLVREDGYCVLHRERTLT